MSPRIKAARAPDTAENADVGAPLPSRRALLAAAVAAGAASLWPQQRALAVAGAKADGKGKGGRGKVTPVLFVSHTSPELAHVVDDYSKALVRFITATKPKALIVASSYFRTPGTTKVIAAPSQRQSFEAESMPATFKKLTYRPRGAPEVARRIQEVLWRIRTPTQFDYSTPLDWGTWVPVRQMLPVALLPVIGISLPADPDPAMAMRLGASLLPLREEGFLLVGSGQVIGGRGPGEAGKPPAWAVDFDRWLADQVAKRDDKALMAYATHASAAQAAPRPELLSPLFFCLGASNPGEKQRTIYEGFRDGPLSLRTIAFG